MAVGRVFSHDTDSIMPYQPFITAPPFIEEGEPIGINLRTVDRVVIDEYQMHEDDVTKSMINLFVGLKTGGKTTAMKWLVLLGMLFQAVGVDDILEDMRLHIDNRKPEEGIAEWGELVKKLACKVVKLNEMGLEILDPITLPTEGDRLITALGAHEFVRGGELDEDEVLGLRIAVFMISRDMSPLLGLRTLERACRTLDEHDITDFYDRLDSDLLVTYAQDLEKDSALRAHFDKLMLRPSNIRVEDIQAGAARVSKLSVQIIDGKYGKMFAGRESLRDYMIQPAALFDLGDTTEQERRFFEFLRFNAMSAALNNHDLAAIPHFHVREEVQEESESLPTLRAHAYFNAKARAFHMREYNSTQYFGNMRGGEPGSMTRMYTDQILNGTDMFYIFQQSDDPTTREMLAELSLSDWMIDMSMHLPRGCCIIKPRERDPILTQITPPQMVLDLAKSQGATKRMLRRRPITEDPRIQKLMKDAMSGNLPRKDS